MNDTNADEPRPLLQIYREAIRAGCESRYEAIEEQIARRCHDLGCPHPYLGAFDAGASEAWYFNEFASVAEQAAISARYAANAALMEALAAAAALKATLTSAPRDVVTRHVPELSRGASWRPGRGRFVVVERTPRDPAIDGTVYEAADGGRFVIRAAGRVDEATMLAAAAGARAVVLQVRPMWSSPAAAWIDADPAFWSAHPAARAR